MCLTVHADKVHSLRDSRLTGELIKNVKNPGVWKKTDENFRD
jgi:hypothetical protein